MNAINKLRRYIRNPYTLVTHLGSRGMINWIPDRIYLKMACKGRLNKYIDIDNPKTFNEKLQWLKLNDRNELYTELVDKYNVRKYISNVIGEEYLIPLIGVYDNFEQIEFDKLPNKFVIKCTHDSGGVFICKDKNNLKIEDVRCKINKSLNKNFYWVGREWPYKNIKPRIIIENFMQEESGNELKDYKFMCFNGEAKCVLVCSERNSQKGVKMDFFDMEWNKMNCKRPHHPNSDKIINKPIKFNQMVELANKLSKEFSFVRVDFYEINEKIYFGELTFYPASGFDRFEPDSYDDLFGDWLKLPKNKN